MSVVALLAELRKLDAHVVLDGDRLRLNAPAGALTDRHRRELQQHKAEIVEFLRSAQELATQQRAIVPLESRGTRIPIFAVAGHNGDVFCYRALARHLGPDQPFFGLQPPGLEEGTEPCASVEALAAHFARQIREFRTREPVSIAGFCAGGTVAFELARQLSDTGMRVANLILLGAPYCASYRTLPQLAARCGYFVDRAVVHVRALIRLRAAERRRYLADRRQALLARPGETVTDPVIIRRMAVEEATMAAVRAYTAQPFDGHVDIVLPCESWKRSPDRPLRWGRFAAGSREFTGPADCNGDTMLLAEHAAAFAVLVEAALEHHAPRMRPIGSGPG